MKVKHYWIPALLLLVGAMITFVLIDYAKQRELNQATRSVAVDTDLYTDHLTAETERSLTLLGTLRSFFSVSDVDRTTFDRVVIDALKDYRQLQAVIWVPRVTDDVRESYQERAQQQYPGYQFKVRNNVGQLESAPQSAYYYPIFYQKSRAVDFGLGLNLAVGLLGKELNYIRDQGPDHYSLDMKPSFDALIGGVDAANYLMVMMPVYRGEPTGLEAYRESFKGFLIGAIHIDSIIDNFLSFNRYSELSILVSDVTNPDRKVFLTMHEPRSESELLSDFLYESEATIVGDRHWLIEGVPTKKYLQMVSTNEWMYIVWVGAIISLTIAGYVYNLRIRAEQVEEEVKARTRELSFANRKLERLTRTDALTQLANRRYFDEYLEKEWYRARRDKTLLSLILCDVDFFKKYNDTYGHIEGDRCLQRIALALKNCFSRSGDVVARYGGEEFAVILPGTVVEAEGLLAKTAETIETLHIPHINSAVSEYVTMSFGACVIYPSDDLDLVDIIKSADQALYRAKLNGRNQSVVFNYSDVGETKIKTASDT